MNSTVWMVLVHSQLQIAPCPSFCRGLCRTTPTSLVAYKPSQCAHRTRQVTRHWYTTVIAYTKGPLPPLIRTVTHLSSALGPHVVVLPQEFMALAAQHTAGGPEEVHQRAQRTRMACRTGSGGSVNHCFLLRFVCGVTL
jgi:hypothetical protein